jgi:hypothetical protein
LKATIFPTPCGIFPTGIQKSAQDSRLICRSSGMECRHQQRLFLAASLAFAALGLVCNQTKAADRSEAAPTSVSATSPSPSVASTAIRRKGKRRGPPSHGAVSSGSGIQRPLSLESLLTSLSWCNSLPGPQERPRCAATSTDKPWNHWKSAPPQEPTPGQSASVDLQPPAGKIVPAEQDVLAGQSPALPHWTIRIRTDFPF